MGERRIDGFFYGLFMDSEVLKSSGVEPSNVRQGFVNDFALRIGNRATLIPSDGARAYGMVVALTHAELDRLYSGPGLEAYKAEAVLTNIVSGGVVPALCYNLIKQPSPEEKNQEYALRLQRTLRALNFPREYVDSVATA